MDGLNRFCGMGNLGADPELRVTPSGQAVLGMRIACTTSFLNKDNTRQERVEWVSVSVWGKRGEGLAKILNKGDRVYFEGELRTSTYEKDGEKRYRTEVVANNIVLAGGGARSTDGTKTNEPPAVGEDGYPTAWGGAGV